MRNIDSDRERIYADCEISFSSTGTTWIDPLRNSTVMVTGATGFVGCWLLSALAFLNDMHGFGIRIAAVARDTAVIESRAPFLAGRKDIAWLASDVRQLVSMPDDLSWLMHAAGVPDSRHHATSPIDTASVIAEGTFRVLRLAGQAGSLQQILHFSSGLVDASSTVKRGISPTTAYVEAKRFSEALCYAFRTQAKLPIVVTRPFTLLGPFQRLDSPWAANNFLRSAIEGQPLKIRGDGQAIRSYLYGSDMAVIALNQMVRSQSGEIYDLGGSEPMTVLDLAHLVAARSTRPLEILVSAQNRFNETDQLLPDMHRCFEQFGIRPAFSTAQAVERSLSWYNL